MSFLFGNLSTLADRPCMGVSGRSLVQSILRSCNHGPTVIVLHVHYTCIHRLRTGALQLIASNYMYIGFFFLFHGPATYLTNVDGMHGALVQLSYMYYHIDMNGEKDLWCSSTQKEGSVVL